jgi:hypothetical protein
VSRRTRPRSGLYAVTVLSAVLFSACHSYHIDATVENHTGTSIQLLEVDYPSASFGADSLATDASFQYRFQVRGSGQLKMQYTAANGQTVQITGPTLTERQQGTLEIVLEPGGKAEFHAQLIPPA